MTEILTAFAIVCSASASTTLGLSMRSSRVEQKECIAKLLNCYIAKPKTPKSVAQCLRDKGLK